MTRASDFCKAEFVKRILASNASRWSPGAADRFIDSRCDDAPLVMGGQGRTPESLLSNARVFGLVALLLAGGAFLYFMWRAFS